MMKAISASIRGSMKRSAGNRTAMVEKHVLEQNAAVGNVDVQRILHGLRGQADLPAADGPAGRQLAPHEIRLDGIGVIHVHAGMRGGNQPRLRCGRVRP